MAGVVGRWKLETNIDVPRHCGPDVLECSFEISVKLCPRFRTSLWPNSSNLHGSSVSGNGAQMTNMAANPNNPSPNPTFPGHNGLIGPERSAESPAVSSSRAMEGEDVNLGILSISGTLCGTFGFGRWLWLCERRVVWEFYPLSTQSQYWHPYTYDHLNYQNPYGLWEEPFRGFPGPSVGSRESGALGERKKRKREDSTADTRISIQFLDHPIMVTLWTTIGQGARTYQVRC